MSIGNSEPVTGSSLTISSSPVHEEDLNKAKRISLFFKRFRSVIDSYPWLNVIYISVLFTVGFSIILAGVAMLVLPGPGWLTIFLGLAVLGIEFKWARNILTWLRNKVSALAERWKQYRSRKKDHV